MAGLRRLAPLAVAVGIVACAAPTARPNGSPISDGAIPAGLGTLRQDEITLQLRSEALLVQITPLDEAIIRLTAPDTYARLVRIRGAHDAELTLQAGQNGSKAFFVSFFSYQPDVTFQPEDLQLVSLGLRYRPRAISPITPEFGAQRLDQQDTQSAIYGFAGDVAVDSDLVVEYAGTKAVGWDRILSRLELERSRVRARAGIGGDQLRP